MGSKAEADAHGGEDGVADGGSDANHRCFARPVGRLVVAETEVMKAAHPVARKCTRPPFSEGAVKGRHGRAERLPKRWSSGGPEYCALLLVAARAG
jgi:hypothetical protein